MYRAEGGGSWDSDTWARVLEPGVNRRMDYEKDPKSGKYTPQEIALVCFGNWPSA